MKLLPSQIWMMQGLKTDPLTAIFSMTTADGRATSSPDEVARLVGVVAALREHCPWTAALTQQSLGTYLLEESYEFLEVLETGPSKDIAGELGDILLQVVLHSRLAQEAGDFALVDVARGLSEKLIRRSPHVFHADGTLQETFPASIAEIEQTWERVKAAERVAAVAQAQEQQKELASTAGTGIFAGIPRVLPALALAQKTLERAARADRVEATSAETARAIPTTVAQTGTIGTEEELGKALFDVVRVAHQHGFDAERALRQTVRDFQTRLESR